PTSIRLAPATSSAGRHASVVARSGYPAGMNGISAIPPRDRTPANVSAIDRRTFPPRRVVIVSLKAAAIIAAPTGRSTNRPDQQRREAFPLSPVLRGEG